MGRWGWGRGTSGVFGGGEGVDVGGVVCMDVGGLFGGCGC